MLALLSLSGQAFKPCEFFRRVAKLKPASQSANSTSVFTSLWILAEFRGFFFSVLRCIEFLACIMGLNSNALRAVAAMLISSCLLAASKEFTVEFKQNKPLGIRFDARLRVQGFGAGLGADSKWLKKGDTLVSVNGVDVRGKKLPFAARKIQGAPLPKVLTFEAASGGDRVQEMAEAAEEERATKAASGVLTLFDSGVAVAKVPFVRAAFGGPTKCKRAPVVAVNPEHGCSEYKDVMAMQDHFVIVERGVCSFVDKAMMAEARSAMGVIVLNTQGEASRLPKAPGQPDEVALPVISIGSSQIATLRMYTNKKAARLIEAQMVMAGEFCENEGEEDIAVEEAEKGTAPSGEFRVRYPTLQANANADYMRAVARARRRRQAELDGEVQVKELEFEVDEEGNVLKTNGDDDDEMPPDPATLPYDPVDLVIEFVKAEFGGPFPFKPLRVVAADPLDACTPVLNSASMKNSLVLVERGRCSFATKVKSMSQAGAAALIAINSEAALVPIPKGAVGSLPESQQMLPTIMIPRGAGHKLRRMLPIAEGMRMANSTIAKYAPFNLEGKLKSRSDVLDKWKELNRLEDRFQWPEENNARRKMFLRLSKTHHPDKGSGSADRFASLQYFKDKADHVYHPGSFKHPGDFLG